MSNKFNPLVGTKVVVIGGTSGMGYGGAEAALDREAVVLVGSSTQDKVDAAVSKLQRAFPSGSVHGHVVNLREESSVESFFTWVDGIGNKGLDHLIYSAGDHIAFPALADTEISALADSFDVRLFGIFRAVKAAQPLLHTGGSVTLTSGTSAYKPPGKGWTAAGAIMGAVGSLTRSLAVDLAPIRVNAVCPGMVQTEMWDSMLDAEARSAMFATGAKSLLTGRVGQPEDIAQGYIFCMSSRFLTGQTIVVDGGALIV